MAHEMARFHYSLFTIRSFQRRRPLQLDQSTPIVPLAETVEKTLKQCARAYAHQAWSHLAADVRLTTTLIHPLLTAAEQADPAAVGLATYALFQWAVDQLKPAGPPQWQAYTWRAYLLLQQAYLQATPFAALARQLAISEQTVFQSRRKAIAQLVTILSDELDKPQAEPIRRHYLADCRYAQFDPSAQQLLALLAANQEPQPLAALLPLLPANHATTASSLHTQLLLLQQDGALTLTATGDRDGDLIVAITPIFQAALAAMRPAAVSEAHQQWAAAYAQRGAIRQAVAHYHCADRPQAAATLLLTEQRALINSGATAQLLQALQRFQPEQVDEPSWARLKVLAGDLAIQQQDLQAALDEYQHALTVADPELRALAYHRRARAFLSLNLDEALLHYQMALATLAGNTADPALYVRIQCDCAWFYIQERPNLLKAAALLRELQATVQPTNPLGRSYIANAWAGLYHRQGNDTAALAARLEAWTLANTAADREWAMTTGVNVGNDYVALAQYTAALDYYAQSRVLADQLDDIAMAGLIEKSLGACYFWLADYPAAANHYQRAYQRLQQVNRTQWLVHLCYDLAELFAQMWDYPTMRRYVDEGMRLCRQLRNHKLLAELETLAATVAWLEPCNERQQAALRQAKSVGAITNRDYQSLTGCAQRQAVRDLNELCDLGILHRDGQGRAVRYLVA